MTPFDLVEPATLEEAVSLLDAEDPTIRPISGGTALMLMMKAGVFRPTRLVSLRRVERKTAAIEAGADGGLRIGAMTPLAVLERSEAVRRAAPVVTRTLITLSNIRVRNVATVGGCLAHGDPHMDLPPVLIALDAQVVALGPAGKRTIPVENLFAGYFETVLARNELIVELQVPAQGARRAAYIKCTTGTADDWPALGIAVLIDVKDGKIAAARLAVSAATEKAMRLATVEQALTGGKVDDKLLARAGDAAVEEAELVSNVRGTAAYKRELLRVHVGRAVREALSNGMTH